MTIVDEDAKIERAAMALCFVGRPIIETPMQWTDMKSYWLHQFEVEQRLYIYRARVVIEVWEGEKTT